MSHTTYEEYLELMRESFFSVEDDGCPLDRLSDTFQWKKPLANIRQSLHYDHFGLPYKKGLLLSGNPGNGRHTYANAYIQSVCHAEMCFDTAGMIRFRADDFSDPRLSCCEEIRAYIDAAFAVAGELPGQAFLFFDQMERYKNIVPICNYIADAAGAFSEEKCHVICIVENDRLIPEELRRLLWGFRCVMPNREDRIDYLRQALCFNPEDWNRQGTGNLVTIELKLEGVTTEQLADEMEGFSYKNMSDFVNLLKLDMAGMSLSDVSTHEISVNPRTGLRYLASLRPERSSLGFSPDLAKLFTQMLTAPAWKPENRDRGIEHILEKKDKDRTVEENMALIDRVPPL